MLFQLPLDLPLYLLSPSLAPCPVTACPRCEDDRVISVMSSKGNGRQQRGLEGDGGDGGGGTALPAILAFAVTRCDTRKRPARHTRFIFFTVGCQGLHSPGAPSLHPRHQTFSLEDAVKWRDQKCFLSPSHMLVRAQLGDISVLGRSCC